MGVGAGDSLNAHVGCTTLGDDLQRSPGAVCEESKGMFGIFRSNDPTGVGFTSPPVGSHLDHRPSLARHFFIDCTPADIESRGDQPPFSGHIHPRRGTFGRI